MASLIGEVRYALRQFLAARVFTITAILGLPLAVGAGYLLSAQLYGVRFWDPLALAVGALSLAVCAVRRGDPAGAPRRVDLANPRLACGLSRGNPEAKRVVLPCAGVA